ncbi:MAG: YbaK/EbsC family protein [Oscillospiraceae bacterium]|nr:YbaK/EbsC family protein [Oscillospiraceae bacterium]
MSKQSALEHLKKWGKCEGDIIDTGESTATVALAAQQIGVAPERIAKSLAVYAKEGGALLVVAAGTARLDNQKFKAQFGFKPRMLSGEDTAQFTGHIPGGVCPFGLPPGVDVYLDRSLEEFESVYPACGTSSSSIKLTLPELEEYSQSKGWVDVCKAPEQ